MYLDQDVVLRLLPEFYLILSLDEILLHVTKKSRSVAASGEKTHILTFNSSDDDLFSDFTYIH